MDLLAKIDSRSARIGVLGLGYVGLPLVIEFCRAGFSVTGFDLDVEKVSMLRQGKSYIRHIDSATLAAIAGSPFSPGIPDSPGGNNGKKPGQLPTFHPTTDFSLLQKMDCIIICVPTPLNKNREPDMRYVFNSAQTIAKYLRKGQLVVLESTTYPGTTDQDVRAILEESGLIAGRDFHLAFSPEREDPNN